MTFVLDKITSALTREGDGPINTASSLSISYPLDKAGTFNADMPATDERASLLEPNTIQYVQARIDGTASTVGIIRQQTRDSKAQSLQLSGVRLLGELEYSHVGRLFLHGAAETDPMPAADVLSAILSGSGWTWTGTPSKAVYYQFGDETRLGALTKIAQLLGDHFRESDTVARQLEWLPTTAAGFVPVDSELRAVDTGNPAALESNDDVCLIVGGLKEVRDGHSRITAMSGRGGGNADARLYITNATSPLPAGFSRVIDPDPSLSYIKYDSTHVAGPIIVTETFRDIAPIGDSAADEVAAANMLQDAIVVALRRRLVDQRSYRFQVTKVRKPLRPGDSIRLTCRHFSASYGWLDIDEDVLVLDVRPVREATGGETYDLTVTQIDVDRYPSDSQQPARLTESDVHALVQIGRDAKAALSHLQPAQRASSVAGTIAATPITARATQTTLAQSIPNGTLTIIDFDVVTDDPQSAIATGASWHYTCPVAGRYNVSVQVMFASTTTWAAGEVARLDVYVSGAIWSFLDRKDNVANPSTWMRLAGEDVVTCAAGDTIDIRVMQNSGAALTLVAIGGYNRVVITRVV